MSSIKGQSITSSTRLGKPVYMAGANRSVKRLAALGYDPIGELVKQYRRIEQEITYLHKLRSGELVELNSATGKPRAFRGELLYNAETLLQQTADKLLRYGYGRVPEVSIVEEKKATPLVINLASKGEAYVLNNEADQLPAYADPREDEQEEAMETYEDDIDPLMVEAPPVRGTNPKDIKI